MQRDSERAQLDAALAANKAVVDAQAKQVAAEANAEAIRLKTAATATAKRASKQEKTP